MKQNLDVVINGKKLKDWLKSDEGRVDYSKCEAGMNVSNSDEYSIYDLGAFYHDPSVRETWYHNGVDLVRVAGVAISIHDEYYDTISEFSVLEGYDYARLFFSHLKNATIQDFVYYFFRLLDGEIYISETNCRVYVKGRKGTQEEIEAFVSDYQSRCS